MTTAHIWIVDDDESLRWVLQKTFSGEGMAVRVFEDAYEALEAFDDGDRPDVMLSDIRMPGMDGLKFLEKVQTIDEHLPVIIMTAHSDLDSAVSSYKTGAFEYLPKPFDLDEAIGLVKRALQHAADRKKLAMGDGDDSDAGVSNKTSKPDNKQTTIIGESAAMQEVFRAIGRLSHSNITVLINGESGTGKELVAAALHEHSPRKDKALIALNMAAIPSELIEAELFGHEKGAFTGATSQRKGRFEQADGGTLFLDEIGDMPFATQTRLLRVLADGEFFRVGGHTPVKVDVRIIAATHQNLESLVEAGKFREDLFYRLNVIRMQIPALRERREDIPMLATHFLSQSAKELDVEPKVLTSQSMAALKAFNWRGNVRQLQNTCRWLMVMASGREIDFDELPDNIKTDGKNRNDTKTPDTQDTTKNTTKTKAVSAPAEQPDQAQSSSAAQATNSKPASQQTETQVSEAQELEVQRWEVQLSNWVANRLASGDADILTDAQPKFESVLITEALKHTKGRKGDAAKLLGWGRNTLTRKLQELGL